MTNQRRSPARNKPAQRPTAARDSRSGAPPRASLPRAAWQAVMRRAKELFAPGNRWGVVAYGIRPQRRKGQRDGTVGLVAYVVRKRMRATEPVPALTVTVAARSMTVVPDVIGTGQLPLAARADEAAFSGLHAGGALRVDGDAPELGSIGCLLAPDPNGDPTHLITAGHLFEGSSVDEISVSCAASSDDEPFAIGILESNLLDAGDRRRAGVDVPRDAALVALNDDGRKLAFATRAPFSIRGVRRTRSARGEEGQVFSWMAGDFSPVGTIVDLPIVVHFDGSPRGPYSVADVLALEPRVTDPGNSGGALLSLGQRRRAVGLCVGAFRMESVFEPLDRALEAFGRSFGPLVPWNNPEP